MTISSRAADLGRFLRSAPLANGTTATLPGGVADLVAEAVLEWIDGRVWDGARWAPSAQWVSDAELGEVSIDTLSEDGVTRITHRETGVSALGESAEDALRQVRMKIAERRGDDG